MHEGSHITGSKVTCPSLLRWSGRAGIETRESRDSSSSALRGGNPEQVDGGSLWVYNLSSPEHSPEGPDEQDPQNLHLPTLRGAMASLSPPKPRLKLSVFKDFFKNICVALPA